MRPRQTFEKKNEPKKAVLGTFWKHLIKKLLFPASNPLKINICLAPLKNFRVSKPKMDISKQWGHLKTVRGKWGDFLGRQRVKYLRVGDGGGSWRASVTRRPLPKSAGSYKYKIIASFSSVSN